MVCPFLARSQTWVSVIDLQVAGLVGGALSMGCGEYISVSSQRDAEVADIAKEIAEQRKGPAARVWLASRCLTWPGQGGSLLAGAAPLPLIL